MSNYTEKALNSMFPKPVSNVQELINKESCIDGNQVCDEKVVENLKVNPIRKNDIFMKPKKKRENIVLEVKSPAVEKNVKKDRYAHLAEARKKGAETRRLKAIERKALKDDEKEEKKRIKEERKKASVERNRQRARDRYYAKQENKKIENKKILKEDGTLNVTSKPINIPPQKAKEMDFNTFASHMLKYENMKQKFFNEQNKKKVAKPIEQKKEYHPKNYPLSHLYNPANRKNTTFF